MPFKVGVILYKHSDGESSYKYWYSNPRLDHQGSSGPSSCLPEGRNNGA